MERVGSNLVAILLGLERDTKELGQTEVLLEVEFRG